MPRFIYPPYYMSPNVDFNAGYSLYGVRRYETQRASQEGKHPPKAYIEEFCAKIRKGLDKADFNVKRQIIQLFDIRGKIAFENGERVLYLKCLIEPREPQAVSRVLTSHWRCNLKGTQYLVSARLVLPKYGGQKSSKRENEDASANAEAFCLGLRAFFAKEPFQ